MGPRAFNYGKHYGRAHARNLKWFSGRLDPENVDSIAELVAALGRPPRLLDYGSGKGYQYLRDRAHDRWGGVVPWCYDPGVHQLAVKPEGLFDGVICTDVMEHIAEPDVDGVLDEIFAYLHADRPVFAYFNVFCNLASKSFPDGTNVHLTVKHPNWWRRKFVKRSRTGLTIRDDYEYVRDFHLQP